MVSKAKLLDELAAAEEEIRRMEESLELKDKINKDYGRNVVSLTKTNKELSDKIMNLEEEKEHLIALNTMMKGQIQGLCDAQKCPDREIEQLEKEKEKLFEANNNLVKEVLKMEGELAELDTRLTANKETLYGFEEENVRYRKEIEGLKGDKQKLLDENTSLLQEVGRLHDALRSTGVDVTTGASEDPWFTVEDEGGRQWHYQGNYTHVEVGELWGEEHGDVGTQKLKIKREGATYPQLVEVEYVEKYVSRPLRGDDDA